MQAKGSAVEVLDIVFKLLILLFCLAMIVLFVWAVIAVIRDGQLSDQVFKFLFSVSGSSGAFYLYMRWRIIEITYSKWQSEPENVSPEVLKRTLSLIPRSKRDDERSNDG